MPRLTNQDFLNRHYFLERLWDDDQLQRLFATLSPHEQWDLHQYYQTLNRGSDADLVATRRTVNLGDKSLTNRAGKSFRLLQERYFTLGELSTDEPLSVLIESFPSVSAALKQRHAAPASAVSGSKTRQVSNGTHRVLAIVKPEIDKRALARVFLELARLRLQERKAGQGPSGAVDLGHHGSA